MHQLFRSVQFSNPRQRQVLKKYNDENHRLNEAILRCTILKGGQNNLTKSLWNGQSIHHVLHGVWAAVWMSHRKGQLVTFHCIAWKTPQAFQTIFLDALLHRLFMCSITFFSALNFSNQCYICNHRLKIQSH